MAPRRAVLVDHDDARRAAALQSLVACGCAVQALRSGAAFIDWLALGLAAGPAAHPDVLVVAADLPDVAALELLADLRRLGWRMPLIVLASSDQPGLVAAARQLAWRDGHATVLADLAALTDAVSDQRVLAAGELVAAARE